MTDFPPNFQGRDRYGPYTVLAVDGDDRLVRYDDGREARRVAGNRLEFRQLIAESRKRRRHRSLQRPIVGFALRFERGNGLH